MIIVIASMEEELAFSKHCEHIKTDKFPCFTFEHYKYKNKSFITAVCGSGKIFSAICAQKAIEAYHPELLINIGTSGSLGKARARDIVIGTDTVQYDYDASPFGWEVAQICGINKIEFPCDKKAISILKKAYADNPEILFGRVMSADRVIVKKQDQDYLSCTFGGLCCEMEAAGIAQVAYIYSTPYALIKAISDGDSDEENREDEFRTNISATSVGNAQIVLKIISEYN